MNLRRSFETGTVSASWAIAARGAIVLLACGAAPSSLFAQDAPQKQTAEQRLERAALLQDVERDVPAAIEALRAIADDAAAPKDVRAKAYERLVRALRSSGRDDDATQATARAIGAGLVTEEAAKAWSRDDELDARMRDRVRSAVTSLLNSPRSANAAEVDVSKLLGFDDLVWIGEPAVPVVIEEIFAHANDLDAVNLLSRVIARIGGDGAARFIEQVAASRDELFKRAVIKGMRSGNFRLEGQPAAERLHSSILPLVHDSNPAVRQDAVVWLGNNFTNEELAGLLEDPDVKVRRVALGGFAGRTIESKAAADALDRALEEALRSNDGELVSTAQFVLRQGRLLQTQAGSSLFVRILLAAGGHSQWPVDWAMHASLSARSSQNDVPVSAAQLVELARKFGPFAKAASDGDSEGDRSATIRSAIELLFERKIQTRSATNQISWRDPFSAEERPLVYELAALGVRGSVETWITQYGRADEIAAMAHAIEQSGFSGGDLSGKITILAAEADENARADAAASLVRFLNSVRDPSSPAAKVAESQVWNVVLASNALVALRVPGLGAVVVTAIRRLPTEVSTAWKAVVQNLAPPAESFRDEDLVALMSMQLPSSPDDANVGTYRDRLFGVLVARGSESGIAALPELFRQTRTANDFQGVRRLTVVWRDNRSGGVPEPLPKSVPIETVRKAVRESLAVGSEFVWTNAAKVVDDLDHVDGALDDPSTDAVIDEILAALPSAPFPKLRDLIARQITKHFAARFDSFVAGALSQPTLRDLVVDALGAPVSSAFRAQLEANLNTFESHSLCKAIELLGGFGDERAAKSILPFLDHKDASVRASAVAELPDLPIDDAWKRAAAMLKDRSSSVRVEACNALGRLVDPRAVPALVETLRDESAREAAKAALEKIQFYVDQKARWDRLSAAGGLDATSAAAALVKQAGASQPKETRVAAIASLGTLGVAETLPLLIEWMGDRDPDVATAAKSAVDRINAKAAAHPASDPDSNSKPKSNDGK